MLFKILRQAVGKLKDVVHKGNRLSLPEMIKLEDQLVKNIINCTDCVELRKKLIRLYESENVDFKLVVQLIEGINSYSENGGNLKRS